VMGTKPVGSIKFQLLGKAISGAPRNGLDIHSECLGGDSCPGALDRQRHIHQSSLIKAVPSALIERDKVLSELPVVVRVIWVMGQDSCPKAICGQLPTSRHTKSPYHSAGTIMARFWMRHGSCAEPSVFMRAPSIDRYAWKSEAIGARMSSATGGLHRMEMVKSQGMFLPRVGGARGSGV
jgi:hypothetical protein